MFLFGPPEVKHFTLHQNYIIFAAGKKYGFSYKFSICVFVDFFFSRQQFSIRINAI